MNIPGSAPRPTLTVAAPPRQRTESMAETLDIAVRIDRDELRSQVLELLGGFDGIRAEAWRVLPESTLAPPAAIVMADHAEAGATLSELQQLRESYPQAAIFVISGDQRPEHIVALMKAGATEYLSHPLNVIQFREAVEELRARRKHADGARRGRIYSFISAKGGIGATIVAVNTAATLAREAQRSVALCDLSLRSGDASVLLDLAPRSTIVDLCRNSHRLDFTLLRGAMTPAGSGLDFLAAPLAPEDCEEVAPQDLGRILELAGQLYDEIVVDCPSLSPEARTLEVFRASERIVVLTDLSVTAVRNTARLCQLCEKAGINPVRLVVVVNRFTRGSSLSLAEVEKALGRTIFWLFPNAFDDIISSINQGVPLVRQAPGSAFARNVTEFVAKLQNPAAGSDYRGIRGTFGKAL